MSIKADVATLIGPVLLGHRAVAEPQPPPAQVVPPGAPQPPVQLVK
jgi:hypothetical protein